MRIGSSAFPVDSSDLVEAISLKLELVVCFHAKLLRFGYKALKIREGDNSGVEHDSGARESHELIQAHNWRDSEVDGQLTAVVIGHIDDGVIFGADCAGRLQEVFDLFDGERGLVFINGKSHAPMIAQAVI